mgnify:CR=1 FL=1
MSIRHLDSLFDPRTVAVIGASARAGSVGATVWHNLRHGGYRGTLMPLNAKGGELDGVAVVTSVDELPQVPDLAVVCTPPASVPELIDALGRRGTRAAIVMTAGFDPAQKQAMLDAARRHHLCARKRSQAARQGADRAVAVTGNPPAHRRAGRLCVHDR